MARSTKIILAFAVLLALILVFKNRTANEPTNTLKIGAILPLTGDLAYVGQEMQKGMDLALEKNKNAEVKIIYEDDQSLSITPSVNALNKLVNVDKVDIVFSDVVDTIKALSPILNQKKVPGIVVWDNNQVIAAQGDYVFGMGFSTELAGSDMAEMAYNQLGLKHISVVSAFNEWSEVISKSFINAFQSLGGTIDYHERVDLTSSDLRVHIAKIQSKKSEGIYFPLFLQSIQSLIKQARELGFEGYLMNGDPFNDADIRSIGRYAEGIFSTQVHIADNPEFAEKYQQKYKQEASPINLAFAGMGYDAVNFILAIKQDLQSKNLPITSQNIQSRIVGFEFSGVTGKTVFSSERITDKRETILKVQNGLLVKP